MNSREQATRLEISTIRPITLDAWYDRARDLFTVWFGSTVHVLIIVTCSPPRALDILVQLLFVASALYTDPIGRAIGGIDFSWIVGLTVTSPVYYWLAKRTAATWRFERPHGTGAGGDGRYRRQPSRTVY
jgi:purine-cytosine permease-like protein